MRSIQRHHHHEHKKNKRRNVWRTNLRDTLILFRQFRIPLVVFSIAILGIGSLYFTLSRQFNEPLGSWPEAIYLMLGLSFLQPSGSFPAHPSLYIWFFLMPLVGVGTLALGLADFGILLFNRRSRSKEWEMAVASTFKNHTILVGLGHLGFRVIQKLHEMEESVIALEMDPSADLFAAVQAMNIPVIQEDGTKLSALEATGVQRAKTIILCMQSDSTNLQIALKARSLNPGIQVVIRIFDEDFAEALTKQFGFTALSATGMAAPVFAAAAAGADVTNPISIEGQQLSLARLTIPANSYFVGKTVGFIEDNYHLNIVLVRSDHQSDMHPTDRRVILSGDMLAVLGGPEQLNHLMHDNTE